MYSETFCFENELHYKLYVFIAATATPQLWLESVNREFALIALHSSFTKKYQFTRIQHSEFYSDEQLPHTPTYIFLQTLNIHILSPLQLTVILLHRAGLSFKYVMAALNLKEDLLKKLIKQILKITGVLKMKNFI